MLIETFMAAVISAGLIYYYGLSMKYAVLVIIATIISLNLLSREVLTEGFSQTGGAFEDRVVYYGDSITIYSHKGKFMRMHTSDYVDGSSRRANPEEIPNNWIWEHFVIEHADDPRWRMGARIPVKFGDKIYLRSWKTNWVSPRQDTNVLGSNLRREWERITIESPDITGKNGRSVSYGDEIHLKTWRNMWISDPENTYKYVQSNNKDKTTLFRIYDSYGSGQYINWAARGFATQSSQYGDYNANNAIDNDTHSFNHTQNENNAWISIELPTDVNVTTIRIVNRRDCCQDRLKNFDVTLIDHEGKPVFTRNITDVKQEYEINNVGRTGRVLKIQLRGKNYLHVSGIDVRGTPVNYSTLLETPVSATLLAKETDVTEGYTRTLYNESVPYLGHSKALSLSMFVKPDAKSAGTVGNLIAKGVNFQVQLDKGVPTVLISTEKGVNNIKSTNSLSSNWNHIAVVYKPQIKPDDGWIYGEFISKPNGVPGNCCYIVNPVLKMYYRLTELGPFANAVKQEWKADYVNDMQYRGDLKDNVPTLCIYINGQLDTRKVLDSIPSVGNEAVTIGALGSGKAASAKVNMIRFYNYSLNENEVVRASVMQHNMTSLLLTRGIINAATQQTIGSHLLPSIKSEVSVSFWLRSERNEKGSGQWDVIFWKGNKEPESAPGMWFSPKGNQLYAPVKTFGAATSSGIKEIKADIKPKVWYHITQVLKSREQLVYINGKLAGSATLPGDVEYNTSPIKIGGFTGKLKDFTFHNFALTAEEILNNMGRHPEYKTHEEINKIWREQGCMTDLFEQPGEQLPSTLTNFALAGNIDKVHKVLQAIKDAASKGDKDKLMQCYGPYASELYTKYKKSNELLKYTMEKGQQGKKCLPTAPFTCKERNINDFDIRTHRDFHKYTLSQNIIPPAYSSDNAGHPDFKKFTSQLIESKKALEEMKRLKMESENKNKQLVAKLSQLQKQTHTRPEDVIKHPTYQKLQNELQQERTKLSSLEKQHKATKESLEIAKFDRHPEYKRMAEELKNAREAAAANIAQNMDMSTLHNNPMFRDTMKQVAKRMAVSGSNDSNAELVRLEQDLRKQKQQLDAVRAQTLQQLTNTRQLANDIFHGIAGLSPEVIDNIIKSKGDLSNNKQYQDMMNKIKQYSSNGDIKQHPEYQKLVKKLNVLTRGDIDGNESNFKDFVVQGHKCAAMFEQGKADIPKSTLIKLFKERVKTDPDFKALLKNIVESTAASDRNMSAIMQKAKDEQYANTPEFQDFLMRVTKQQLKSNPVYSKMVASMMRDKCYAKHMIRLEDHPEYNKYASDMSRQCAMLK